MDMITLTVDLGTRSYPIYIAQNLLQSADYLRQHIKGRTVLVVTNETIAPLYLDQVMENLQGFNAHSLILPDGEQFKNIDTLTQIYDKLLQERMDRHTTLVALGGGVIGDITGYAAASYQRGVPFIQIPTTLLSQVDSSVGGKTAVNHPLGKNMIGAFHQPQCVIADTNTLDTLPDNELAAGMAEVVKYGLLGDAEFLTWITHNVDALLARDKAALAYAIERSCQNKADIVAADERESGVRALLNLGHTFGHAIETAQGYGNWLHGEAVAAGTCMAADLSHRLGWITADEVADTTRLFQRLNLPVTIPSDMTADTFIQLMSVDKKAKDGIIRLVLLKSLGDAIVSDDYPADLLHETLTAFCKNELDPR